MRLRHLPPALTLLTAVALAAPAADAQRPSTPTRPAPGAPRTRPAATPVPDTLVDVTGFVYDSIADAPLAGATVQLVSDPDRQSLRSTTSDTGGFFRIAGVKPGRYIIGFFHPSLDVLGVDVRPAVLQVARGHSDVSLGSPGIESVREAVCANAPRMPGGPGGTGLILGRVHDADTESGIPRAKVVVTWNEVTVGPAGIRSARRRLPVTANESGVYAACGLPDDGTFVLSAESAKRESGLVEVKLPAERPIARRDFALGDSASAVVATDTSGTTTAPGSAAVSGTARGARVLHGTARLAGTVRNQEGAPVANARLFVWGSGVTGATRADGGYTLTGLPAGTFSLEVRAIGYDPQRTGVDLRSNRTVTANVTLGDRVQVLADIRVTAKNDRRTRDLNGFEDRARRGGWGKYFHEDDITKMSPVLASDILRRVPGMNVSPSGGMGYTIQGRGGCTPDVFLDGMPITDGATDLDQIVQPSQITGIEVYNGQAGTPVEFSRNSCGAVVIWTKR